MIKTGKDKVGRNDPCPCGSGRKYKFCCLNNEEILEQKLSIFLSDYNIASKAARIKQCIHPNKGECRDGIVKAHAIQNNRILSRLSVNGMVWTVDGVSNLFFQGAQSKGRKVATTFTGFCAYHDKILFQPIEDREFEGTPQQVFLYTYRTFAWHYHKKLEGVNRSTIAKRLAIENKLPGINNKSSDLTIFEKNLNLCAIENEDKYRKFNQFILKDEFDQICFSIWEIPYEIDIAVSSMLEIEHDISGNVMNNLKSPKPLKSIYLNIFPNKEKSYCIWSWLIEDYIYDDYVKQFMNLSILDRCNYLNNNLPRWTDSIIISPRLWDEWGKDIQQALISHANFEILYRQMEFEEQKYYYEYMDTPWNFFRKLS